MDKLRTYFAYSVERAIKTVAQTAVATILASQAMGLGDVDWAAVASISALAGLMSLLTSVASYNKGNEEANA